MSVPTSTLLVPGVDVTFEIRALNADELLEVRRLNGIDRGRAARYVWAAGVVSPRIDLGKTGVAAAYGINELHVAMIIDEVSRLTEAAYGSAVGLGSGRRASLRSTRRRRKQKKRSRSR